MKRIGILGAAFALLLFAANSQATTIDVSVVASDNSMSLEWGAKRWNVETDAWSQKVLDCMFFCRGPRFHYENTSHTLASFGSGGLESVIFAFAFDVLGPGLDSQYIRVRGLSPQNGASLDDWTWMWSTHLFGDEWQQGKQFGLDIGGGNDISLALRWEKEESGSGSPDFDFFLADSPLYGNNTVAVPTPGVVTLFGLAIALLGGVVVVRRRRVSSST